MQKEDVYIKVPKATKHGLFIQGQREGGNILADLFIYNIKKWHRPLEVKALMNFFYI